MFRSLHSQTVAALTAILLAVTAVGNVGNAAPFQNLDFESATLPSLPPNESGGYVPIAQGMPGWRIYWGDIEQTLVLHNDRTAGSANVSIFGPQNPFILEGNFTALLQAGIDRSNPNGPFLEAAIGQTGIVPSDAQSIQFKMSQFTGGSLASFHVELEGQHIPVVPLFITPEYTLFGGDVAAYAGASAELRFIAEARLVNSIRLDDIVFSSAPVPEPSTWALLSAGLICFATYIRKRARC